MSTPHIPNIPGAAVMTDTLDFVKSLWGSMGVPGLASPTLSLDELDKKINDLKAVEAWLNLNTAMLRSSIQALEVQRGTIATLKSMGQSLADTLQQRPDRTDKSFFDANPYAAAFFQHADPAKSAPKGAATAAPPQPSPPPARPEAKAEAKPEAKQETKPEAQPEAAADAKAGTTAQQPPKPDLAAAAAAQMANPAIWWNMLQEQFKQAVSTAMAPDPKAAVNGTPTSATAAADGHRTGNGVGKERQQEEKPANGVARKAAARKTAPKKE